MPLGDDLLDLIERDRETARRLLLEMVEAMPQSVEARHLLAGSYLRGLEYPDAAQVYRSILDLAPTDPAALHSLAFSLASQGDDEGALTAYRRAMSATSTAGSMFYVALLQHRLGRLDEAARTYETLLSGAQKDSPELVHASRGAMAVMRDVGRPQAADRYAEHLADRFRQKPLHLSSQLVERSQAMAFHEWPLLVDKAGLALSLQSALAHDPAGARVPPTFVLPGQRADLLRFAAEAPIGTAYIVKPIHGSGGQGISIVTDPARALDRTDVIVQRYVERPHLVDGRKGHLRIYALITSAEPLRAYIYSEGIVRFAPAAYDARPERLSDVSAHITNTALHLGHPELIVSDDPSRDDIGAIWSLNALLRRIQAEGRDPQAVFGEIADLVSWFLSHLRRDGFFERQARRGPPHAYPPKLFGLDVLLDAELHPWLLEIQTSPAMTGAPLVNRINGELFKTIFQMTTTPLGLGETANGEEIAAREREIAEANRGLFVPLDL